MKHLAKLLDQPEKLVAKSINKLEKLNGYPSHDARQLAQNSQAVRQKIADLGLDADDTTGEELYQALLAKYSSDSLLVDKALGIESATPSSQRLDQAVKLVKSIVQSDGIWVLKHSAAKKLLRSQPPKRLMKQLRYRSVESLLKRENIAEIYSALSYAESSSWQRSFSKAVAQLVGTDYELRSPEIIAIDTSRWQRNGSRNHLISSNGLIGSVALWPSDDSQKPVLTLSMMLLDALEEMTHTPATDSIASINPSLLWWEQSKSLVALCDGQAVSLNYKDVAQDHLAKTAYRKRGKFNGRTSIWNELVSRYEKQEQQLEESVARVEDQVVEDMNNVVPKQPAKSLAAEYAEAIANEF